MIRKAELQDRIDELEDRLDNQEDVNNALVAWIKKLEKTKEPNFDRRKTGETKKRGKNRKLAAKRGWETRRKNQAYHKAIAQAVERF